MQKSIRNSQQIPVRLTALVILISCSVCTGSTSSVVATTPATPVTPRAVVRIESIEPASGREAEGDVAWLGVYAEEISEALSSQLGLTSGEGLLITYVAADSPASKAGLQKNDILVALRDQLLVHPSQLIKLIRAQKDGDVVSLAIYRQGKRQAITATLGKRPAAAAMWPASGVLTVVDGKPGEGSTVPDGIHGQIRDLHGDLMRLGADKEKVKLEVERSMEEARKALQGALQHKGQSGAAIGLDAKDLEALARGSVEIGENATIVVKKNGRLIRTIIQTDETGSYVIAAIPKKRLTARDKDGKLLFDGEIETSEQQGKVPAELWEKVKPLLQQLKPIESDEPKPRAESQPDDLNS
jgi:membrane-associated protease RseP (regulator of RpoE activity)